MGNYSSPAPDANGAPDRYDEFIIEEVKGSPKIKEEVIMDRISRLPEAPDRASIFKEEKLSGVWRFPYKGLMYRINDLGGVETVRGATLESDRDANALADQLGIKELREEVTRRTDTSKFYK